MFVCGLPQLIITYWKRIRVSIKISVSSPSTGHLMSKSGVRKSGAPVKSGPLPVPANKVLLEHSQTGPFVCALSMAAFPLQWQN